MSAPVDVLAVMDADGRAVALAADSCVGLRQKQWVWHLAVHEEARAAVAELVEAAVVARRALAHASEADPLYLSSYEKLDAALEKFGGAP